MANTPDVTECTACRRQGDARLPIDPWRSLAVHFGMLLGVEDFKTVDAYHRGKMWLHSAWLHRKGVIWGLEPSIVKSKGELRIDPGLALDACGRELHLDRAACIDLGRWFTARAEKLLAELELELEPEPKPGPPEPMDVEAPAQPAGPAYEAKVVSEAKVASPTRVAVTDVAAAQPARSPKAKKEPQAKTEPERPFGLRWTADGHVQLDAHVRMRFVGCLDRQVPALVEPCDGAGRTTAYSRVYETVELELVPGLPDPCEQPYPRLRMLFGLDQPTAEISTARAAIAALPASQQPRAFEELFHRLAALDAAKLAPAADEDGTTQRLLPATDPAWFVLAELHGLTLRRAGDHFVLDEVEQLLWMHRPTHVATRPLQDLVAASLAGPSEAQSSKGPRVIRASLEINPTTLSFKTDKRVESLSLRSRSVSLAAFEPTTGWVEITVSNPQVGSDGKTVTADHTAIPSSATRLRLVVDGTSSTPLLGVAGWPLAGADDDPPTPAHAGRDFAHIERRGE